VQAQDIHPDSSLVLRTDFNRIFLSGEGTVRSKFLPSDIGFSSASMDWQSQSLKSPQVPDREFDYGFSSYGRRTVKDWYFSGSFSYQRQNQDSVGWKQDRVIDNSPYYFANIRRGNWVNDLFFADLDISRDFFNEKLQIGVGAIYSLQNHNRTNDPRPRINYYSLSYFLQLNWRLADSWWLGPRIGKGSSSELGETRNYNRSNDSFGRSDYLIYTVIGLGSYNLLDRPRYAEDGTETLYGLSITHQSDQVFLAYDFSLSQSDSRFERRGSTSGQVDNQWIGTFFEDRHRSSLFLDYFGLEMYRLQIVGDFSFNQGRDFNNLYQGFNYQSEQTDLNLGILFQQKTESPSLFGVNLHYRKLMREDFNASHLVDWSRAGGEVFFQKQKSLSSNWLIGPEFGLGYSYSPHQSIFVGTNQENIFTTSVVYPELNRQSLSEINWRVDLKASWKREKVRINPFIRASQSFAVGNFDRNFDSESGKNLMNRFSIGLQFVH
jgi:hypothetical protein